MMKKANYHELRRLCNVAKNIFGVTEHTACNTVAELEESFRNIIIKSAKVIEKEEIKALEKQLEEAQEYNRQLTAQLKELKKREKALDKTRESLEMQLELLSKDRDKLLVMISKTSHMNGFMMGTKDEQLKKMY